MKFYQKKNVIENMANYLNQHKFMLMVFDGVMPTTLAEVPFSPAEGYKDLIQNAMASCKLDLVYDGARNDIAKFNFVESGKAYGTTHRVNNSSHAHRILPVSCEYDNAPETNMDGYEYKSVTQEMYQLSDISNPNQTAPAASTGMTMEFTFPENFVLASIGGKTMQSSSYFAEMDLEGWDYNTSDWVLIKNYPRYTFHTTTTNKFDPLVGNVLSTDRYRVKTTGVGSSYSVFSTIEFYTDTAITPAAPRTATWGILVPLWHDVGSKKFESMLWTNVGSPNENQEITLQDTLFNNGDVPTLMNFKFSANVLGAIK